MEFRVLGPLEVRHRGQALALGGAQQRALLAILLTQANRVVNTGRLAQLLWAEAPPATAEHMIVVYVSNLRRALEPGGAPYRILVRRDPGYALNVNADQLDASQFENLVESAQRLPPDKKAAELAKALGLWRGPAYADFSAQSFAISEATRLEELRLHALEERIQADLERGRDQDLIGELEALVNEHPLRERLCGQLMLALFRSGRQAEASSVYQGTRTRLVDELGMEPGPELRSLLTRILKQDPGLGLPGESAEQPSAKLPVHLTSFVGRQGELRELDQSVQQFRIVTLTGTGGSGKTRLAIQIGASMLNRFPDGVWFVDLSSLTEGDFILQAIAGSLGRGEQPGRTLLSTVSDYLRSRTALLILDNCEQVLDAAAQTAEALVTRCLSLHILATSREPLRVEGERVHQLAPLELPSANFVHELERAEAVQLFVDRARLSLPSFSITEQNAASMAELCRQLDGLPLAIELAAARSGVLSPDEILARLGDQFGILARETRTRAPRQRSLRATLDWSYRLLEPAEASLFGRLSVFAGGFYLNAVESIGSDERIKSTEIAGLLAPLCDKSLVLPDDSSADKTRYRLLETVRAFSASRLKESGEEREVRRRHAAFYLEQVKGVREGIEGADAQLWLDMMEMEHDNASSALSWAVEENRDMALELAAAWEPFWTLRGYLSEGRRWLSAVLDGQEGQPDWTEIPESAYRLAVAKQAAARTARRLGEDNKAQVYAEEGLQIGQALQDKGITASLLAELGGMAASRADVSLARSLFNQSLAVLHEGGTTTKVPGYGSAAALEAAVNITLAHGAAWLGNHAAARSHYLKALEYVERTGGRTLVSVSLGLGELDLVDRDLPRAREHFAGALEVAYRLRDHLGISASLAYAAGLAAASGKPKSAMRLEGAASKLRETLRDPPAGYSFRRTIKPELDLAYRQLGQRDAEAQLEAGRAMSTNQAVDYAFSDMLKGGSEKTLPASVLQAEASGQGPAESA